MAKHNELINLVVMGLAGLIVIAISVAYAISYWKASSANKALVAAGQVPQPMVSYMWAYGLAFLQAIIGLGLIGWGILQYATRPGDYLKGQYDIYKNKSNNTAYKSTQVDLGQELQPVEYEPVEGRRYPLRKTASRRYSSANLRM